MEFAGETNERLIISDITSTNQNLITDFQANDLTLLWFTGNRNYLTIDSVPYQFHKNQIICLTEFHKIEITAINAAQMIRFNRSFYCIIDHDSEVGCKGVLFFGASKLAVLDIPTSELEIFETVYQMFLLELQTNDNLQLEMLQMMLKRFLIICARVYKNQTTYSSFDNEQTDIIREYNFLVETHFKTKHTVAEYAALLHKSPKTLANLFSKLSSKSPLQFIQERKMLEAKRLLHYTNKSIQEIAYEIGFEDVQAFGRFFKNMEKKSPSGFRKGTIAHS